MANTDMKSRAQNVGMSIFDEIELISVFESSGTVVVMLIFFLGKKMKRHFFQGVIFLHHHHILGKKSACPTLATSSPLATPIN